MNKHAANFKAVAATWMNADPAIFVLDADARRAIGGLFALVVKAIPNGGNGFFHRDQALQFFRFDEKRHFKFPLFLSLIKLRSTRHMHIHARRLMQATA